MIETVQAEAKKCTCDKCGHVWLALAVRPPTVCAKCRSREWNGKKKAGRTHSSSLIAAMPKPHTKRGIA